MATPHAPFPTKTISPSMLSEPVRAQLERRAAAAGRSAPLVVPSPPGAGGGGHVEAVQPTPMPSDEPRRRGEARMRRVRSVETDQGVTILSNRLSELPRPSFAVADRVPGVQPRQAGEAPIEPPQVTETRSLRAMSATQASGAGDQSWFGWLVALLAAGAAVGTFWFHKKTQV